MKISALRLFNVKRFAGRGVAIEGIGDGVNVLCAPNEFGKSTSFEALHALFFQSHTSTAGDVRAIRPYSGGNPVVEADVATANGLYRITKQFYGGRSAQVFDLEASRLIAQADEAENFITSLVQGGSGGPAGLLWVRQGTTGLEKRTRADEDSERQVRTSLLESVQGEVEAVTGGRRMADVLAATRDALSALVTTTGRPKAGGRYAAAVDERDRLFAEEQILAGDVAALREALGRRSTAIQRLGELEFDEDRAARREAIERAQTAFDAVKAQAERIREAEARRELARERHTTLAGEQRRFVEALEQARLLRDRTETVERRRAEAIERRRSITDEIDTVRATQDAADAEEAAARTALEGHDAAVRAAEASKQIGALRDRLAQAEEVRQTVEEADAGLAQTRIPDGAIDELVELDIQIAGERARREVGRPSVTIFYEQGATARVSLGDEALPDGEARSYDGTTTLRAPGIGRIELRADRADDDDTRIGDLEERRSTLLASMGVSDLSAARAQQERAQHFNAQIREARARLALLAPDGLPKLREEVAGHAAAEADLPSAEGNAEDIRAQFDDASRRRKLASQELREIESRRAAADADFTAAETERATIESETQQLLAILGPKADRETRERDLLARVEPLAAELAAVESEVELLHASAGDLDSASAALNRMRSIEQAIDAEIAQLREELAGLNAQIRTRSDEAVEEIWQEVNETLAAAAARAGAFEKEVAVLQRLLTALETARTEARELYLKPVMTELKPLLGLLFDDVSITFDDRTLLPQTISRGGLEEDIDRLSGGMREQLSVLTRLAFARLLARDGRPAPVILDDALVYSDDDRIEKMFDALHRQAQSQQIIVFSCRQRAFQKLGGNLLQMTEWNP